MKILLFKIGALGDVLMTTPLIKELKKSHTESQIDYLVGNNASKLINNNPYLSNVLIFDENIFFKKKLFGYLKLINNIRKKKYDYIFVLDKHWIFNLTAMLFNIKKRIGFNRLGKEGIFLTDKVYYGPVKHEITYYLELASLLNTEKSDANIKIDIVIPTEIEKKILKFLSDKNIKNYTVLINSGGNNVGESGGIRKMPEKLFKDILDNLSKKTDVLFVGGPEEREYYEKFSGKNIYNFAGATSIIESAVLLKYAKKIITTDCGLMHLASAVNENIISIFGPTNPKRKAPLSKKCISVWKDMKNYDENYELFGKMPEKREFFNEITIEDIV
ncbi:ADP-heptose:LPS heptosyltransferase [Methanococcus maripaludis]|uniref:ADP-heptose:LPS heptosyltransferase n=1 Tax=Methanococcus maripaludis TaxID=39152 RepID=A0A7J9NZL9_METMI|nr:glycosyltransferase family 9 protein [Methanococcus maripaludis]MBA2852741.1 ADP-heptose:LPS heptosyltransferase [Methanococcus maripaludis]